MCQPVLVPRSTHNCLAITFVFLCFVCCVSIHLKCYFVFLSTASTPATSKTVGVSSSPYNLGATTTSITAPIHSSTPPTRTEGATITTGTATVRSSIQPTSNPPGDGETITTVPVNSQPTKSDGAITPVRSNKPPANDGTTTTLVIIVVAAVIVLIVIVVGVFILVVILRTKKRKQRLVISKLHSVRTENQDIEMELKHEGTTSEREASSSAEKPQYSVISTKALPSIPSKSKELLEYLNQNSTVTCGYSEIELEQDHYEHTEPPRVVNISEPLSAEMEPNPMYRSVNQHSSTTNVPQESDIYTVADTTSSPAVDRDSSLYETVYSEPIQPSLFTGAVATPSDCEELHPYAPIYTLPINLPESKVLLNVFGSNIREIRELGMGLFGKVILAETVGLSAKDLRLSESDDDKSTSTLVAVKKLKSDAPNATKEAFEKEVNFMSRLTDKNVIRILGVCYKDTPFIMMEYMEKGDLNQYLQKFKIHTADSELRGQITTSILVHMATQIASAMKYLASHNYVHRDLATRNCLVGPNYLVKISDFGMSRSLYDSHYYCIHGQFILPVRWMSIECFYGKFSQKSDVWAFGVTMWEIFTLAKEQPYNDMSDQQVIEDALKEKNRKILARPYMCSLEVYIIMLKCWAHNSEQRSTFEELFQLLTSIESG